MIELDNDTIMFIIGIGLVVVATIMMIFTNLTVTILAGLGILFIAVSRRRIKSGKEIRPREEKKTEPESKTEKEAFNNSSD